MKESERNISQCILALLTYLLHSLTCIVPRVPVVPRALRMGSYKNILETIVII